MLPAVPLASVLSYWRAADSLHHASPFENLDLDFAACLCTINKPVRASFLPGAFLAEARVLATPQEARIQAQTEKKKS